MMKLLVVVMAAGAAVSAAFMSGPIGQMRAITRGTNAQHSSLHMGLFGDEKGADGRTKKDIMWEAQQEVLKRRRNKGEMEKYQARVRDNRAAADEKVNMWAFQKKQDEDPIKEWKRLRAEGKIPKLYDEGDNPEGGIPIPMASFGVGGEFGQGGKWDEGGRFDLRLPYVDQGYVGKTTDPFSGLKKMFGGGKTEEKAAPPAAAAKADVKKATGKPTASNTTKKAVAPPPPAAAPKKTGWFGM